jgi:hypothetical protein
MAKHRNSPHFAFWKMLKQGYDHFEVSRLEPKVSVCDRRYVFDAEAPEGKQLRFDPAGRCPAYQVKPELRDAVAEKQKSDETQFATLVQRGTPTVAVRTGRDGGMHQTFLAKLTPRLVRDADGTTRYDIDPSQAAKLGTYVNPPRDPDAPASTGSVTASAPRSAMSLASADSKPAPQAATRAGAPEQESTFGRLSRWVGFSNDAPKQEAKPAPASASKAAPARTATPAAAPKPKQEAAGTPAAPPAPAAQPVRTTAATGNGLMTGASPVVGADSFENRFGPVR